MIRKSVAAKPWYVIRTANGQEETVEKRLNQNGYRTMLPRTIDATHNNQIRVLMPGYIFVCFSFTAELYYTIRNMENVVGFVGMTAKETLTPEPLPLQKYEQSWVQMLNNKGFPLENSIVELDRHHRRCVARSGILLQCHSRSMKYLISKDNKTATVDVSICGHSMTVTLPISAQYKI